MGAAASVSPPDVPAGGADRAGMRALLGDRFDEARFAALVSADGRVSAAAFQRAWAASCLGPGVMTLEEAEAVAKRDGKLVVYDPDSKLATVADVRVPRQSPRRPPPRRRRAHRGPAPAHRAPAAPPAGQTSRRRQVRHAAGRGREHRRLPRDPRAGRARRFALHEKGPSPRAAGRAAGRARCGGREARTRGEGASTRPGR